MWRRAPTPGTPVESPSPRDGRTRARGGGNALQVVIKDRAWGRTSARFGINLSSDFEGNNSFELVASVNRTYVNRLGAEWRVIAGVGEITTINGEFFQPLAATSPLCGADRIVWASDFPHADHTPEYIADLDELAGAFDEPARKQFLGDNARALYGIEV